MKDQPNINNLLNYHRILSNIGQSISFLCLGTGNCISHLMNIPGCSKYLKDIQYLYNYQYRWAETAVSIERIVELEETFKYAHADSIRIYISGALISDRYRRGLHHAYFGIFNNRNSNFEQIHHIELEKPYKHEISYKKLVALQGQRGIAGHRTYEDYVISDIVLRTLCDLPIREYNYLKSHKEVKNWRLMWLA